ncbi:MAG: hypothetical protein AMJ81_10985 [Phycisphaerae bacterium SM23_33]|nr:MAG: hypothetical protein AMJ81_10985 [Phycisphaerae bacterium SM23_33]
MSLINEALKRAETQRQRRGVPSSEPAVEPPADTPDMMPVTDVPAPSRERRSGLRAALFVAVLLLASVTVVTYFALPPEEKVPPQARASHPGAPWAGTEQSEVEPTQFVLRPVREGTAAESSIERTLFAVASYQPPPTPTTQVAAVIPLPAAPPTNPTPPPTTQEVQAKPLDPNDFKLGGILRSGDEAHAIINDHLVSVSDEVDGARVVEIQKYHVVLERDGQRLRLRL